MRPWGIRIMRVTTSLLLGFTTLLFMTSTQAASDYHAVERQYVTAPPAPKEQTEAQMMAKSEGCITCHEGTDLKTMHVNPAV